MRPSTSEIQRLKDLTATNNYTLGEWLFALNVQTRNDPGRLERAALLLEELKKMTSSRKPRPD